MPRSVARPAEPAPLVPDLVEARDVHLLGHSLQREIAAAVSQDVESGYGPSVRWIATTEADANTIKADWNWTFVVGRSTRLERGALTMFRTGTGRQLVALFDSYEFYIGPVGETRWQKADLAWTFRKASKRLVEWSELPF